MIRLSQKEILNIKYVKELSKLSKCEEGKVAAVLFDQSFMQIYSMGINGGPKGQDDCLCHTDTGEKAKYGCVHAEQNCLVKNSNFTVSKIMICSKQCCQTCSSLIVNSGANIEEFWFLDQYKDKKGLQILLNAEIKVYLIYYNCKYKEQITWQNLFEIEMMYEKSEHLDKKPAQ